MTKEKPTRTADTLRFLRLPEVLGLIPISKATVWEWIKEKKFPAPVKLGPKTTAWREADILKWMAEKQ